MSDIENDDMEHLGTQLKKLNLKRGVFKGQLTKFSNFINSSDQLNITNLKKRLEKIEGLWSEFQCCQLEIENIENSEAQAEEREGFESTFFELTTEAQQIIDRAEQSNRSNVTNIAASTNETCLNNSSVKLPEIKLPSFDGTYSNYLEFRDSFLSMVHSNATLPSHQKLNYLKSACQGEAANLLKPLKNIDANYDKAWNILKYQYEDKRNMANEHFRNLFEMPVLLKASAQSLKKFLSTILTEISSLIDLLGGVDENMMLYLFESKLDHTTKLAWEASIQSDKERNSNDMLPNLEKFEHFIRSRYKVLENANTRVSINSNDKKESNTINSNKRSVVHVSVNMSCVICKGNHYIFSCKKFLDLAPTERYSEVKSKQLCTNCLRIGHIQRQCYVKTSCKFCYKRHNSLLHINTDKSSSNTDTCSNSAINDALDSNAITPIGQPKPHTTIDKLPQSQCNASTSQLTNLHMNILSSYNHNPSQVLSPNHSVLLPTAIVGVSNFKGDIIYCRALLDSGSQSNFVSTDLINKLGIRTYDIALPVYGISQSLTNITKQVHLKIKSLSLNYTTKIACLVINTITNMIPQRTFDISHLKLPNNIKLADPTFNKSSNIDILLGAGLFFDLLCVGQVRLGKNLPSLQKTKLGWIVSGDMLVADSVPSFVGLSTTNAQLNEQLQKFWLMDENYPKSIYSKEEIECENHFVKYHQRDSAGRFIVKLPFKDNNLNLGDSQQNAIKRFYSLERKFKKDPNLMSSYYSFIDEYQKLGHMIKIEKPSISKYNYYLPHHAVEKIDSTTTRLRVVFDASAKTTSGLSLNDTLKIGPTIQSDLFTILVRFRQHKIVLIGDIAKMYRQIMIHPDQQDFQRIVWRENPMAELQQYKLRTLTYGTAPASFLATRCLQQVAFESQREFPTESNIILNDFYVDDLLTGCDDVSKMIKIRENLTEILKGACFELRKFSSNDPSVLQSIAQANHNLSNYIISDNEHIKTLGISWQPSTDEFEYKAHRAQLGKVTKRTILSYISQVFDPLGLLGPIVVQAKLILQRLWRLQIAWDESIPSDLHTIWLNFQSQLEEFHTMKIPRHVVLSQSTSIQIHAFCDASQTSFGAAIYIRSLNEQGIQVRLVCAKSRVAPIKTISIPRLELSSAVILARLYTKVYSALDQLQISNAFFWTDSTIVLSWLSVEPNVWQTFVANRVSEIQQLTPVHKWHHIRSENNPADIISRGATPKELSHSSLWWNGPTFLGQAENTWPKNSEISNYGKIGPDIPEFKKTISTLTCTINLEIYESYSNFFHMQRIVALCFRFIKNSKLKVADRKFGPISVQELNISLKSLIRVVQAQTFFDDITALKQFNRVKSTSKISSLNPFVDQEGILRVGGRLRHSNLSYNHKHPIILPSKHPFTTLLINSEHQRHFHAGLQTLLGIIRQRYWPINGKQTVKAVLRKCVVCFKARPQGIIQQMGDLPDFRVRPSRIFSLSGVDYCGPFDIKEGKLRKAKIVKGYICIFVCLASKAVHLELASDLTTQSFINAFKRFVSRRGFCRKIWSDNGTNFVGAKNEFLEIKKLLSNDELHNYLAQSNIEWNFIPANSPHMGGLWEAAVRSVKYYLKRITGGFHFTFEEFYTLLTQVEAILNSRPLIPLSTNPDDLEAITPGHFIIGEALTAVPQLDLEEVPVSHLSRYQHISKMSQQFWKQWSRDYLHLLQQRTKWRFLKEPAVTVGSIVLLKDDNRPPMQWPMGRITALHPGPDNVVRVVSVKTKHGVVKRSIAKVCLLPLDN